MPPTSGALTSAQLAELRAALETKRDALLRSIARRGRPLGDEDRPIEELDLAEREIEESDAAAMAERDHRLLDEVAGALARMAAGTYGVSEVSGEPIPLARLKALPWARVNSDEV